MTNNSSPPKNSKFVYKRGEIVLTTGKTKRKSIWRKRVVPGQSISKVRSSEETELDDSSIQDKE